MTDRKLSLRKTEFFQVGPVVCDDWSVEDGKLLVTNNRDSQAALQLVADLTRSLLETIYTAAGRYVYTFGLPLDHPPYPLAEREQLLFDRTNQYSTEIGIQSEGALPTIEFIPCVASLGFPIYVFSDVPFAENEFVRYCLDSCRVWDNYMEIIELLSEDETVKAVAYMRDHDFMIPIEVIGGQIVLDKIVEHILGKFETIRLNGDSEAYVLEMKQCQFEITGWNRDLSEGPR